MQSCSRMRSDTAAVGRFSQNFNLVGGMTLFSLVMISCFLSAGIPQPIACNKELRLECRVYMPLMSESCMSSKAGQIPFCTRQWVKHQPHDVCQIGPRDHPADLVGRWNIRPVSKIRYAERPHINLSTFPLHIAYPLKYSLQYVSKCKCKFKIAGLYPNSSWPLVTHTCSLLASWTLITPSLILHINLA